ncbi:MAG: hypothetical protein NTW33_00560 [Methanoregula sp.]|nr:hypothetical protein [Methanoregula sp.]
MTDQKTAVTFDKPDLTGFMKPWDMLLALDLVDAYAEVGVKLCAARGVKMDAAGIAFIESKYVELTEYIHTHKTGIPLLEEMRPIIQEWIDLQAKEVA